MDDNWRLENIFLGTGGSNPGVVVYDPCSDEIERVHSFPDGHSVYGLSISPDGSILAAGTKRGLLYRIIRDMEAGNNQECEVERLIHGFPILSVCFLDPANLAVSDTAGRCVLWNLAGKPQVEKLPTGEAAICSLFRLDHDHLAGLSLAGELIVWDLPQRKTVHVLKTVIPPVLSALVKPVFWPTSNSWVWPGQDGSIVVCRVQENDIRTICAHTADVYAVTVMDNELLTVGRTDGCLKRWHANSDEVVYECEAPPSIIAATVWGDREFKMLLINENGKAGIFDLSDNELRFIQELSGRDYRAAIGPDQQRYRAASRQKRQQKADRIAVEIQEKNLHHQLDGLEGLHQQLAQLGCEHISLALRADEARNRDDLVAELEYYRRLSDLIPEEEEASKGRLLRYATLLDKLWQLPTACDLYKRLSEIYPADRDLLENVQRLSEYVKALETGEYVIESNIPLALLVKSATVVGRPFRGLYFIKALESRETGYAHILPSTLIDKYEQIRQADPGLQLPPAKQKAFNWLSNKSVEQASAVIFTRAHSNPIRGPQFGIKLYDAGLQTVLIPVVLFNADPTTTDTPTEKHNSDVLMRLKHMEKNGPLFNAWMCRVHCHADRAIKRLITAGFSRRSKYIGAHYEQRQGS